MSPVFLRVYASEQDLATLKRNWIWFVVLGVALELLGIIGIAFAVVLSFAVAIYFGVLLLIAGGLQMAYALFARQWGGSGLHFAVSSLYLLAGIAVLIKPVVAIVVFTVLLGLLFLLHGAARIWMGLQFRGAPGWVWSTLFGAISAVIGVLIITQLPLGIIGFLVALEMIFAGASFIFLGFSARSLPVDQQPVE